MYRGNLCMSSRASKIDWHRNYMHYTYKITHIKNKLKVTTPKISLKFILLGLCKFFPGWDPWIG